MTSSLKIARQGLCATNHEIAINKITAALFEGIIFRSESWALGHKIGGRAALQGREKIMVRFSTSLPQACAFVLEARSAETLSEVEGEAERSAERPALNR